MGCGASGTLDFGNTLAIFFINPIVYTVVGFLYEFFGEIDLGLPSRREQCASLLFSSIAAL